MAQRGRLGAGEVVLIVDDDVAYCAAIREILDHDGYHPVIANSVEDALELLKDTTPDIILSDTMMPLTDGGSLLRILRRMDRFADLPIVTVSATRSSIDSHSRRGSRSTRNVDSKCDGARR